jgi:alpha-acetolactate decarboxylase
VSSVTAWHDEFIANYIVPQQPLADSDRKKLFFLGIYTGDYNIFLASAIYHFQFSIWEEKLSKRVP